jgi:uncharacterized protein YigA (DUF484 family)
MTRERPPNPDQIAAWLRANPSFLADRPDLFRALVPPRRVHGDVLADHMAAMVAAARGQAKRMAEEMAATSAGERTAHGFPGRAQAAVLALIAAPDAVECALAEWPRLLGVDQVSLCSEGTPPEPMRMLPDGVLARVLPPGRDAWVRPCVTDGPALHGDMAPRIARDALARLRMPSRDLLLVVGAREAEALPPRGAAHALEFLAQALAAAILR